MWKALSKREFDWLLLIFVVFLFLRVPAIHAPYHQDEYKWPTLMNPALTAPGSIPHPPLSEAIYRTTFNIFGSDNFRITPLIFSLANLLLLYAVVKGRYGDKVARWASLFFALSYYSILASLMVDTDGAILPFFFLLSVLFYDLSNKSVGRKRIIFYALLALSLVAGFLVKASFILAIGALALDFLFIQNVFQDRKKLFKFIVFGLVAAAALAGVLVLSKYLFPSFDLTKAVKYWETFAKGFSNRNFFQTFIQLAKSFFFLSPFLVLAGLLSIWPRRSGLRLFQLYLILGLVFYLGLFDFSQGALDRYLQFMIVPLCIVAAVLTSELITDSKFNKKIFYSGLIILLGIFALQFMNQYVPSLYPKTEWISRIASLKWNFLYPFSGGSGPLAFYVSFAFLGISWIVGAILAALFLWQKSLRKEWWLLLLALGLIYNGVFAEEYLFGRINGSASKLLRGAVAFIKGDPDIKKVTVYNDNGGYEIQQIGKYRKRLYTDPAFDLTTKINTLNTYKEHYFELNAPRIDPKSVYRQYLDSCQIIYEQTDRYISARVYDCREAPLIKFQPNYAR